MPKVNLSGMTVEALLDLREQVDEMLLERRAEPSFKSSWRGRMPWSAAEGLSEAVEAL